MSIKFFIPNHTKEHLKEEPADLEQRYFKRYERYRWYNK